MDGRIKLPYGMLCEHIRKDYKLVIIGGATMSPHEIVHQIVHLGGSIEHWNEDAGQVWLQRLLQRFPKAVWLNPQPEQRWEYHQSI